MEYRLFTIVRYNYRDYNTICELRSEGKSEFSVCNLSHAEAEAEVCELILLSTEFSSYQICHNTEFSLLLPFFFYIKSYPIGK